MVDLLYFLYFKYYYYEIFLRTYALTHLRTYALTHLRTYALTLLAYSMMCTLQAQDFCSTGSYSAPNPNMLNYGHMANPGPYFINIRVRVVRDNNGNGGESEESIRKGINYLYEDFAPHNIFFDWDNCIEYIDNDTYFNEVVRSDDILINENTPNAIDIYIYNSDFPQGGGLADNVGGVTGFRLGGRYWVVDNFPVIESRIISHEMGHVLFLYHTHQDNKYVPINNRVHCEEYVNGDLETNRKVCGDLVSDTEATKNLHYVYFDCIWDNSDTDSRGDTYNPDMDNIMAYLHPNSCTKVFTDGQGQRMRDALADDENNLHLFQTTNNGSSIMACDCGGDDLIIDYNKTLVGYNNINNANRFDCNIIIKAGGQLTIKSFATFSESKGIFVERGGRLIIDGGTVTSTTAANQWAGISVQGNPTKVQPDPYDILEADDAGVVIMKNGATIKNVGFAAITTSDTRVTWANGDPSDFWGGLVDVQNSSFVNCGRAVEFMKYDHKNKSQFINVLFEEKEIPGLDVANSKGVSIWDCNGINFVGCTFKNLDNYGIGGIDYVLTTVDNNTFIDCTEGIRNMSSSGPLATSLNLTGNTFQNNRIGVYSLGAVITANQENVFSHDQELSSYGIRMIGPHLSYIRKNSFTDLNTAIYERNVESLNSITCNDFSSQYEDSRAIWLRGNNEGTKFTSNEFDYPASDCRQDVLFMSWRSQQGLLANQSQGTSETDIPADNCFSETRLEIETKLNTKHFYYLVDELHPVACTDPDDSEQNFTNVPKAKGNVDMCLSSAPPPTTEQEYIDALTQAYIDLLNGNTQSLPPSSISILQANKDKRLYDLVNYYRVLSNYTQAHSVLDLDPDLIAKRFKFTLYLDQGDYTSAASLLNSMPNTSQEDQDYQIVQSINIQRLSSTSGFALSPQQETDLITIAHRDHPVAAFAEAIYYFEKNINLDVLDIVTPCGGGGGGGGSSAITLDNNQVAQSQAASILLYPNPVNDQLIVDNTLGSWTQLSIYGIEGKLILSKNIDINSILTINTTTLESGVYFYKLLDEEQNTLTGKLIKQ